MRSRLGGSTWQVDLVWLGAFFVLFLIVDRLTVGLSELAVEDVFRPSMTVAAVERRTTWWVGVAVAVAAVGVVSPDFRHRIIASWSEVANGTTLRLLAAPLIVLLAWQAALYPFNVHADQIHLLDRILVVALALASLWRPVFLIPFALQVRLVIAQTIFPFDTAAAVNISDLPVIVVLLIGVGYLLFALTGRRSTSVVILAIGAAVAAHFYIPGKGKLAIDWFAADDVANLPLASYTAGWLGQTNGSVAVAVASFFDRFSELIKAATIVLELGAVVAVAHRRLLQPWLIGWIGFHVVTFITTGFFFIGWILVEVALLIVLSRRDLRDWVDENATWPRAAVAVAAVLGAPVLFHPAGLAWLDAPVSYGYRLEATGESGARYLLPASTLAPLDHEVMFKRLQFDGPGHLSGAYGALDSNERLDQLNTIESIADLLALEAAQPVPNPGPRAASIALLTDFMNATGDDDTREMTRWLHRLNPPPLFWSSWSDEDYRFTEPLSRIDVVLVTRLHDPPRRTSETVLTRTDPVLTLVRQSDGSVATVLSGR